jgi:hypothetical protein
LHRIADHRDHLPEAAPFGFGDECVEERAADAAAERLA